ncbi:hypothetical protein AVEN_3515-1, partial [Araneus ventricosus]
MRGRNGQAVRSRLWSRRSPGSKPDSTEDMPCLWARCTLNLSWVKFPLAEVVRKFGEAGS